MPSPPSVTRTTFGLTRLVPTTSSVRTCASAGLTVWKFATVGSSGRARVTTAEPAGRSPSATVGEPNLSAASRRCARRHSGTERAAPAAVRGGRDDLACSERGAPPRLVPGPRRDGRLERRHLAALLAAHREGPALARRAGPAHALPHRPRGAHRRLAGARRGRRGPGRPHARLTHPRVPGAARRSRPVGATLRPAPVVPGRPGEEHLDPVLVAARLRPVDRVDEPPRRAARDRRDDAPAPRDPDAAVLRHAVVERVGEGVVGHATDARRGARPGARPFRGRTRPRHPGPPVPRRPRPRRAGGT